MNKHETQSVIFIDERLTVTFFVISRSCGSLGAAAQGFLNPSKPPKP